MATIPEGEMQFEIGIKPQKWEYSVYYLYRADEVELNELGQNGWELVTVIALSGEMPRAYLKRPIWSD